MGLRDYGKNKDKPEAGKKLYFQLHQLEDWSLVTPEILLPSQTRCHKKLSPEQKLLEAALCDSLIDLRFTFRPLTRSEMYEIRRFKFSPNFKVKDRLETLDWIHSDVETGFSCVRICEALDINLDVFRFLAEVCCFRWARNGGEDPVIDYRTVREPETYKPLWHGTETSSRWSVKSRAA